MSESLIGRSLGKYQVLEKLGQGGMGMVFKALQPSLNRTVAIKVLPAQLAMDPEFVQRFRQEAQVIASLQHESIVHVYDIDEAVLASGEKLYFIVMELVEGQTLRQWAGKGRALPTHEVQRIGCELARALDYAHQRGIVHRDIKTANAMVTRDSRVKLMDFGIAKSAGGVRTMTGSVLGTPEYMAPEQARSGKVTPQSDIYSLGVLLYELATGQLPFSGDDAFAVALQHLSKEPPRPREVNAGVPEWLERVILRAMEKEPGDRYASAAQLEAELRAGGGEEAPLAATLADPQAPTLAAGVTAPGWGAPPPAMPPAPPTPLPGSVAAPTWPAPPASSPAAAHWPTTPIAAVKFGAAPPGPQMPPTPPGSYPAPSGAMPTPSSSVPGPGWGAAGAYVPPTPPPVGPGWAPPAPAPAALAPPTAVPPPPTWPPAGPAGAPPPLAAPPAQPYGYGAPASAPYPAPTGVSSGGGRFKGLVVVGLLLLVGIGAVIGAFWSRPNKVDLGRSGAPPTSGGNDGTEAPPPPPDRQDDRTDQPGRPPRPTPIAGRDASPPDQGNYGGDGGQVEPAPEGTSAGPTAGELWSQAYKLKEQEKYHSLREVLDRLIAKDPNYGKAAEWRREVDDWIADREKSLRGDTEDLLDEAIDALADRDSSNLAEQWGGNLDGASEALVQELWDLGPKLKWTARLRSFKAWDDHATFTVLITVADKNGRKLREIAWNGAMADDTQGTRFTAPLR